MTKVTGHAAALIKFIVYEIVRNPEVSIEEETPLVSSGLIDSIALVDILDKLEDVTGMRIPPGKIKPKDMDSVRLMLATARRVGRAGK